MILVDTSVWIDHLHASDQDLVDLLVDAAAGTHPLVIEEIALGSIARRGDVLRGLAGLERVEVLAHDDVMSFVDDEKLWGEGLSAVDVHLLASAVRSDGAVRLWTRDKRLMKAATALKVSHV